MCSHVKARHRAAPNQHSVSKKEYEDRMNWIAWRGMVFATNIPRSCNPSGKDCPPPFLLDTLQDTVGRQGCNKRHSLAEQIGTSARWDKLVSASQVDLRNQHPIQTRSEHQRLEAKKATQATLQCSNILQPLYQPCFKHLFAKLNLFAHVLQICLVK